MLATLLILVSALLHAVVNALVKVSDDGLLTRGCMNAVALAVSLPFVALVPPPSAELWPILIAAVAVHALYPFFLVGAYRVGDLSTALPLARGVAPLGVAALASLFAGERLGEWQMASVALISLGVATLAFGSGIPGAARGRAVALAMATGLVIACYTVLDGIGLRAAATPFTYIVWLFVLDGITVATLAAWFRRGRVLAFVRNHWRQSLLSGGLGVATYGLALYALSLGAIVEIAALRETSVIFAAAIGTFVLGEPFGRRRILAAALVAAGVVLMQASR